MEPHILFHDQDFIVVEKPAHMIVNRADTSKGLTTLQDWIEDQFHLSSIDTPFSEEYMVNGYDKREEFISRSGIVHRLDKETSGIILVAKNVETFIALQNQFKEGIVKKIYITLVHGKVEPREGEIDASIGRLPWNRMRFGVLPEGRSAQTLYKVLEYKKRGDDIFSFVEVYPQTGRTHQIRVHFQHINHPVVSDTLYAGRKVGISDRKILPRHFLHASTIKLRHPRTQEEISFMSPLPHELQAYLDGLETLPPVDK